MKHFFTDRGARLLAKRLVYLDTPTPYRLGAENQHLRERIGGVDKKASGEKPIYKVENIASGIKGLMQKVQPMGEAVLNKLKEFLSTKLNIPAQSIDVSKADQLQQTIKGLIDSKLNTVTEANNQKLRELDNGLDLIMSRVEIRKELAGKINDLGANKEDIGRLFEAKMARLEVSAGREAEWMMVADQRQLVHEFGKYSNYVKETTAGNATSLETSKFISSTSIAYMQRGGINFYKHWSTVENGLPVVYAIDSQCGRIQKFDPRGDCIGPRAWVLVDNPEEFTRPEYNSLRNPDGTPKPALTELMRYSEYARIGGPYRNADGTPSDRLRALMPKDVDISGDPAERQRRLDEALARQREERGFIRVEDRNYNEASPGERAIYTDNQQRFIASREENARDYRENPQHRPEQNYLRQSITYFKSDQYREDIRTTMERNMTDAQRLERSNALLERPGSNRIDLGMVTVPRNGSRALFRVRNASTLTVTGATLQERGGAQRRVFNDFRVNQSSGFVELTAPGTRESMYRPGDRVTLTVEQTDPNTGRKSSVELPVEFRDQPTNINEVRLDAQTAPGGDLEDKGNGRYEFHRGTLNSNTDLVSFGLGQGITLEQRAGTNPANAPKPHIGTREVDWNNFSIDPNGSIRFTPQSATVANIGEEITLPLQLRRGSQTSPREIKIAVTRPPELLESNFVLRNIPDVLRRGPIANGSTIGSVEGLRPYDRLIVTGTRPGASGPETIITNNGRDIVASGNIAEGTTMSLTIRIEREGYSTPLVLNRTINTTGILGELPNSDMQPSNINHSRWEIPPSLRPTSTGRELFTMAPRSEGITERQVANATYNGRRVNINFNSPDGNVLNFYPTLGRNYRNSINRPEPGQPDGVLSITIVGKNSAGNRLPPRTLNIRIPAKVAVEVNPETVLALEGTRSREIYGEIDATTANQLVTRLVGAQRIPGVRNREITGVSNTSLQPGDFRIDHRTGEITLLAGANHRLAASDAGNQISLQITVTKLDNTTVVMDLPLTLRNRPPVTPSDFQLRNRNGTTDVVPLGDIQAPAILTSFNDLTEGKVREFVPNPISILIPRSGGVPSHAILEFRGNDIYLIGGELKTGDNFIIPLHIRGSTEQVIPINLTIGARGSEQLNLPENVPEGQVSERLIQAINNVNAKAQEIFGAEAKIHMVSIGANTWEVNNNGHSVVVKHEGNQFVIGQDRSDAIRLPHERPEQALYYAALINFYVNKGAAADYFESDVNATNRFTLENPNQIRMASRRAIDQRMTLNNEFNYQGADAQAFHRSLAAMLNSRMNEVLEHHLDSIVNVSNASAIVGNGVEFSIGARAGSQFRYSIDGGRNWVTAQPGRVTLRDIPGNATGGQIKVLVARTSVFGGHRSSGLIEVPIDVKPAAEIQPDSISADGSTITTKNHLLNRGSATEVQYMLKSAKSGISYTFRNIDGEVRIIRSNPQEQNIGKLTTNTSGNAVIELNTGLSYPIDPIPPAAASSTPLEITFREA